MSILDKYETSEHRKNIAHFAAIVRLAKIDGEINEEEQKTINRFASKLNIEQSEYEEILMNFDRIPINSLNSSDERLECIFDLFKIIYADHYIDEPEKKLVLKYAIALGCRGEKATELIEKSIKIFQGDIGYDDYQYLIRK